MAAGELISAETIKNKYTGKGEKPRSLVAIFEDHNNRVEALLGDEFAPGTLDRYKTSLKHTIAFMQWKYNISDIDIKRIDHSFITDYEFYLRSVRKCANNTAVKYIKNFGKIIRICLANEWLTKNPFVNYKANNCKARYGIAYKCCLCTCTTYRLAAGLNSFFRKEESTYTINANCSCR